MVRSPTDFLASHATLWRELMVRKETAEARRGRATRMPCTRAAGVRMDMVTAMVTAGVAEREQVQRLRPPGLAHA